MRYLYITLISCFLALNLPLANAQIITTVAGGGNCGNLYYCGDGGPATAAELTNPYAIAFDAFGNLYIADQTNNLIRMVNSSGIITTVAGSGSPPNNTGYSGDGGQAVNAKLFNPYGLTIDAVSNLYIADTYNFCIRKVIKSTGIITTIAGNGTQGYSGDGGQATSAEFNRPFGLAIDTIGNLYIADQFNNCVRKINTSNIITTIAGSGSGGYSGDGGQATLAELFYPTGVALDNFGNIYIADTDNNRIRKINTLGIITTVVGNGTAGYSGDGGAATAAELNWANDITIDAVGNLYIGDDLNKRVRIVNTLGIISTIAGTGTTGYSGDGGEATLAELSGPSGVTLDAYGNLYLSDIGNRCIRKVTNVAAAGIEQFANNNEQVIVYPNPTTGMLHVEGILLNEPTEVTIIDMLGNSVYHSTFTTQHNSINIAELNSGVYVIELSNSKGKVVKRLIKE